MTLVTVVNDYPVDADRLWAVATDYDALCEIMKGIVEFEGIPSGRTHTGQKLDVMVSLFGKLPKQPYHMEILECDDERHVLRTSEKGSGVKSWKHTLTVEKTANGSRLTDSIEIDAGLITPLVALWAKYLYSARHKPRMRLLTADATEPT
ncbi:SRPBCC family protein [Hoeflea prorocentri]|uniref:SRPBCC family protein n=1 Tax=Hoeflea prorocentri TaxID=1922333 RepID=A0A9X3ZIX2_9HYPH|nr:SRPBCC family protein [Hoeflea prorocentri]MCY6382321.1 SRPBCC family protein [Hoeflea prorocentri]MDA5400121.1 SRPBCC family protein [Hoeflea prorocentri]